MGREESTHIGSGTAPFLQSVRPPAGGGRRRGPNVVIINPEDLVSTFQWRVLQMQVPSGAAGIAAQIPPTASGALPFRRMLEIQNLDTTNSVFITYVNASGYAADVPTMGRRVGPSGSQDSILKLPLMSGVAVYGVAETDNVQISVLEY